ncbi:MAG: hypothetical protein LBH29_00120 [Elusimicrobiota bacterium]|jgi:hypothetical protein|nr:hypothetical protein [Elusimicrobiota bacterium]
MSKLIVFCGNFVEELKDRIDENKTFYQTGDGKIDYSGNDIVTARDIEIKDTPPILSKDDDISNAVKVYEYLPIDNTLAADERLWVYMTHITFANYARDRWSIKDGESSEKISTRWFLSNQLAKSRALRRNAVSRLWWSAHLTAAPWEKDDYFNEIQNGDRFIYTKALLKLEDAASALMERKLGYSNKILIAILEYMRCCGEFAYKKSFYSNLIKEVNLELGYRKMMILNFKELLDEIGSIAEEIKINKIDEDESIV